MNCQWGKIGIPPPNRPLSLFEKTDELKLNKNRGLQFLPRVMNLTEPGTLSGAHVGAPSLSLIAQHDATVVVMPTKDQTEEGRKLPENAGSEGGTTNNLPAHD